MKPKTVENERNTIVECDVMLAYRNRVMTYAFQRILRHRACFKDGQNLWREGLRNMETVTGNSPAVKKSIIALGSRLFGTFSSGGLVKRTKIMQQPSASTSKAPSIPKDAFVYLACPYSHESYDMRSARAEIQQCLMAYLISRGVKVFAPIEHSWRVAEDLGLDDAKYWLEVDKVILPVCTAIIVPMIYGWDKSEGIKREIEWAKELKIPVYFLTERLVREICRVECNNRKLHTDPR